MNQKRRNSDSDDVQNPHTTRRITGKDLKWDEELRIQISTLVEILDEKGIMNKKEYQRIVSMRLHEISKALAFDEIDEEI
jgi:predicted transcriptional regulator YheO